MRIAICLSVAIAVWLITSGWHPVFPFRAGQIPLRGVAARVGFEVEDESATRQERNNARSAIECIYDHDVNKLVDLRAALREKVLHVAQAKEFEDLDEAADKEFLGEVPPPAEGQPAQKRSEEDKRRLFALYRGMSPDDPSLEKFDAAVRQAFTEYERLGLFEGPQHQLGDGRMTEIRVRRLVDGTIVKRVPVDTVRIGTVRPKLKERLAQQELLAPVADHLFTWLSSRLPETLTYNRALTAEEADLAVVAVETVMEERQQGVVLAPVRQPIDAESLSMLKHEHAAFIATLKPRHFALHSIAMLGLHAALYILCGCYMFFRRRDLLIDIVRFTKLLSLVLAAITLSWISANWNAELIPLVIFSMIAAITYQQELALLLSASVALVVVVALGQDMVAFVTISATMASAILLLHHVRSRSRIVYVGIATCMVAILTTCGIGMLSGWPVGKTLLVTALRNGFFSLLAGLLMTSLLPFIEKLFDVQTEISLLELGDVAHPLLQELVRRAPGTYNHSINVASLAASAADAIGANGLLARVGAYYHDIGKMLKPGYFVENQSDSTNRHETLEPAMSTLVIIAHVKDGADLARQHHLPQSIVDFVLQHHGTTLVEFFYRRASKKSEQDPDKRGVDEGTFRYPGPKPQSREAAVLMVADAVESASRTLVDPTPARLEGLVQDISKKRLLDGQFDECSLTLKELRTVEISLVKSLAAVYHGRVKYPEPEPVGAEST